MTRISVMQNGEMSIKLYDDEADHLLAKAIAKSRKYEKIAPASVAPYGFNHPHSHFVGMVAEHTSVVLFHEIENMLGIDLNIDAACNDESREGECDIYVGGLRIEVKGIKYGSWLRYGPCISTRQLTNIKKKADYVLWVMYNERCGTVNFIGFNKVDDIESVKPVITGDVGRPQILNYPVKSLIKPLSEMKFKKEVL